MYKDDVSLMLAIISGDVKQVQQWLNAQKDINAQLNCKASQIISMKLSAFQIAIIALGSHPQLPYSTMVLDLFINSGAKISEVYDDGRSALHHAIFRQKLWVIDYLISKGVDVNVQNNRGRTVFHSMQGREMTRGMKFCWDRLIRLNPDFNLQDTDGNTPLHLITNIRMVGIMLKNGARLDIQNHKGQYPDEAMAESYGGENTFTKRLRDRRIAQEARALKKLCAQSSPKALSRQRL